MSGKYDHQKKKSVQAALDWLLEKFDTSEKHTVGVGSGTTVAFSFPRLAQFENFECVPTSEETRRGLSKHGANLVDFDSVGEISADIDGADEVDPDLNLLKGGGGCHNLEKKVAENSEIFTVVVDESKIVSRLGETRKLPVEVGENFLTQVKNKLSSFGDPKVRTEDGERFLTDGGNAILDVSLKNVDSYDLPELESEVNRIDGVVENGIFAKRKADIVFVGRSGEVEILKRTGFNE